MKSSQVEAFVMAHWQFLTAGDMAEELNIAPTTISQTCKKLGVKAISKKQQHINYIIDMCHKKTLPELAIKLGVEEPYLKSIYAELGIVVLKESDLDDNNLWFSAPRILGRFKVSSEKQTYLTDPRYAASHD